MDVIAVIAVDDRSRRDARMAQPGVVMRANGFSADCGSRRSMRRSLA
jgi:hypothetical protein